MDPDWNELFRSLGNRMDNGLPLERLLGEDLSISLQDPIFFTPDGKINTSSSPFW